jgi:hypothetical protein
METDRSLRPTFTWTRFRVATDLLEAERRAVSGDIWIDIVVVAMTLGWK